MSGIGSESTQQAFLLMLIHLTFWLITMLASSPIYKQQLRQRALPRIPDGKRTIFEQIGFARTNTFDRNRIPHTFSLYTFLENFFRQKYRCDVRL